MSTATADAGAPPAKGKMKLILIVVAALLLVAMAGVGAMVMLKQKANAEHADDGEDGAAAQQIAAPRLDPKNPPAYVPLEPFTVNLADKQADRYAQVAMTLELADPSAADAIKAYMPAVRNNILLALAHKTAVELMEPEGKARLADQIRRETARALGIEVQDPDEAAKDEEDEQSMKKKRKSRKSSQPALPVAAVHFSTFIIQ